MMNRRAFGMTLVGMAAAARAAAAQAPAIPSWSQFKPLPGSLKEKMHSGQRIRSAAATIDMTRAQLQEISKKVGGAELFSLDAQHRPLADERELVKFCKMAEEMGAGVQLRIQHQNSRTSRAATPISACSPSWCRWSKKSRPRTRRSTTSTILRSGTGAGAGNSASARSRRPIA
jgi:hypothetical protein